MPAASAVALALPPWDGAGVAAAGGVADRPVALLGTGEETSGARVLEATSCGVAVSSGRVVRAGAGE
ncbi:MAG: hypothetical protein IT318_17915 [Anaerolineales bacterium]|nr:hypothetical protein [Anaerolineales bacterium]